MAAEWRRANPERMRANNAEWFANNRERAAVNGLRYRARKRGALGSHTVDEWHEKLELFAHLCAYCGEAKRLVREHRIPLIRGGSNSIDNIVPACWSCNSRKALRTDVEFLAVLRARTA